MSPSCRIREDCTLSKMSSPCEWLNSHKRASLQCTWEPAALGHDLAGLGSRAVSTPAQNACRGVLSSPHSPALAFQIAIMSSTLPPGAARPLVGTSNPTRSSSVWGAPKSNEKRKRPHQLDAVTGRGGRGGVYTIPGKDLARILPKRIKYALVTVASMDGGRGVAR